MQFPESNRYQDLLAWLYQRLPMFQRVGAPALKYSLDNIRSLCATFGNPHLAYPVVHVAGTNGKGTVSHLIAASLQASGLRVGLHTSPHYRDFRERIKINGEMISKSCVKGFIRQCQPLVETMEPSFFELTTLMAFTHFRDQQVDVAVIETGLGGRLDSTNVVDPLISVITGVHYDHMAFLGDTLPQIAREKAGIIKKGKPVVIGPCLPEVEEVFVQTAAAREAPLIRAEDVATVDLVTQDAEGSLLQLSVTDRTENATIPVQAFGPFLMENVMIAYATWQALKPILQLAGDSFERGLAQLKTLTYYIGRWQWLGRNPDVLADSAHNEEGLTGILAALTKLGYRQIHFVIGVVKDKAIDKILPLFPSDGKYYFVQAKVPRALPASELARQARQLGLKGKPYTSVKKGLAAAKQTAMSKDLIFVGGSTFVVAEVL